MVQYSNGCHFQIALFKLLKLLLWVNYALMRSSALVAFSPRRSCEDGESGESLRSGFKCGFQYIFTGTNTVLSWTQRRRVAPRDEEVLAGGASCECSWIAHTVCRQLARLVVVGDMLFTGISLAYRCLCASVCARWFRHVFGVQAFGITSVQLY